MKCRREKYRGDVAESGIELEFFACRATAFTTVPIQIPQGSFQEDKEDFIKILNWDLFIDMRPRQIRNLCTVISFTERLFSVKLTHYYPRLALFDLRKF